MLLFDVKWFTENWNAICTKMDIFPNAIAYNILWLFNFEILKENEEVCKYNS